MKIIAEVTLIPIGSTSSISTYIEECQRIFKLHHCKVFEHSLGTNIEGDFNQIMKAIKHSINSVHNMGILRVHTHIQIDSRFDKNISMDEKFISMKRYVI
jgi:uncharacterized protein (TIGR00106 family)